MTKAALKAKENRKMPVIDESPNADAEGRLAAARVERLVDQIAELKKAKTREYRGSNRQSVHAHYQRQIDALMAELVDLLPYEPPPPEPTPVSRILAQIDHQIDIYNNPNRLPHVRHFALVSAARLQLERQDIDGTPPSIDLETAERLYTEALAEQERLRSKPPPAMGQMANREGAFQRRQLARETELISDPVAEQVQAQKRNFQAAAAQAQYVPTFAGKSADALVPNVTASPAYDLNSRGPSYTKPAALSGRTR
jgi:hypothetical protein